MGKVMEMKATIEPKYRIGQVVETDGGLYGKLTSVTGTAFWGTKGYEGRITYGLQYGGNSTSVDQDKIKRVLSAE